MNQLLNRYSYRLLSTEIYGTEKGLSRKKSSLLKLNSTPFDAGFAEHEAGRQFNMMRNVLFPHPDVVKG